MQRTQKKLLAIVNVLTPFGVVHLATNFDYWNDHKIKTSLQIKKQKDKVSQFQYCNT